MSNTRGLIDSHGLVAGLGSAIVGAWGVYRLALEYQDGQEPGAAFAVLLMAIGVAGGTLALGAALRLIARRRM